MLHCGGSASKFLLTQTGSSAHWPFPSCPQGRVWMFYDKHQRRWQSSPLAFLDFLLKLSVEPHHLLSPLHRLASDLRHSDGGFLWTIWLHSLILPQAPPFTPPLLHPPCSTPRPTSSTLWWSPLDALFSDRWAGTLKQERFLLGNVGVGPSVERHALREGQTMPSQSSPLPPTPASGSFPQLQQPGLSAVFHVAWFPKLPQLQPSFPGWLLTGTSLKNRKPDPSQIHLSP